MHLIIAVTLAKITLKRPNLFFFFVTTVSGWESLAAVTKKSILVPAGVLDSPLREIEMRKLNKHHISGSEFYEINILLELS